MTYTVTARHWKHGWELHIRQDGQEVGATQSRSLDEAEHMVRDYLALMLDLDNGDNLDVKITPVVDAVPGDDIRDARDDTAAAYAHTVRAADKQRTVARRLKDAGVATSDIATLMGVQRSRIYQLLKEKEAKQ